jgi:hypothetical protein
MKEENKVLDETSSEEVSSNPSGPILFFRGMRIISQKF